MLGNPADAFSVNKFYGDLKSLGIAVAKDTLHRYLAHLENAFQVRMVSVATDSERHRMVNPRKVYPIDPGLIPILTAPARPTSAMRWRPAYCWNWIGAEVRYVHPPAGREVDFLVRYPTGREELIQVCASLDDPDTREREMRALIDAASLYPEATRNLIALDIPAALDIPSGVALHSVIDWMLVKDE